MTEPTRTSDQLREYLRQLTPQVRSRLLAELERLHLLGQDIPQSEPLMAGLRAEFRSAGQSQYRIGNPSRYFFEPLEPVLVNEAPELANSGQIARGSLTPIWSLVTEKSLPRMADDYIANTKKVIFADNLHEARQLAAAFQKKVLAYFEGVLGNAEGIDATRATLEVYTSSHASFDDLTKMLRLLRAQDELKQFAQAIPPVIVRIDGRVFLGLVRALDTLKRAQAEAVPFALTIIARRLETPSNLLQLATRLADDRTPSAIATAPYGIAVSMVLDQIAHKRRPLLLALKQNSVRRAKEILQDIYEIEDAVRTQINVDGTDWGKRLDDLMAAVQATVKAEIDSIPTDHRHLIHVLESPRLRPGHPLSRSLGNMVKTGRHALAGLLPGRKIEADPT